jgi:hypothetical protein
MIALRRHPLLGILLIAGSCVLLGLGLFYLYFWLVFAGVINLAFGLAILIVPVVVIEERKVSLRNLFGQSAVEYPHDGIANLRIVQDCLMLRDQSRQALVKRITRRRFHPADWRAMEARLLSFVPRTAPKS